MALGDGEDISFSEGYRQKALGFSKADFIFGIRPEYLFFKEKLEKESNYFKIKLVNVERDDEAMATLLTRIGFDVYVQPVV